MEEIFLSRQDPLDQHRLARSFRQLFLFHRRHQRGESPLTTIRQNQNGYSLSARPSAGTAGPRGLLENTGELLPTKGYQQNLATPLLASPVRDRKLRVHT